MIYRCQETGIFGRVKASLGLITLFLAQGAVRQEINTAVSSYTASVIDAANSIAETDSLNA